MDSIGFVIGNGESRLNFDLNLLRKFGGRIYGCNALYRDFDYVDCLVCVDERMIKEVFANYDIDNREVVYREWINGINTGKLVSTKGMKFIDVGHSAGGIALYLMCDVIKPTSIFMIGFDIWGKEGKINNVYKGTDNYLPKDSQATYSRNWVNKLASTFARYEHITFYRVGDEDFDIPIKWKDISNLRFITYEDMMNMLEGGE